MRTPLQQRNLQLAAAPPPRRLPVQPACMAQGSCQQAHQVADQLNSMLVGNPPQSDRAAAVLSPRGAATAGQLADPLRHAADPSLDGRVSHLGEQQLAAHL